MAKETMRSKEFILGADLYIKAVETYSISDLFKNKPEYASVTEAFRNAARPLIGHGVIYNKDKNVKEPRMNVPAAQNIHPLDHQDFVPRYTNLLNEIEAVRKPLERDGKGDFLGYFDQTHVEPRKEATHKVSRIYPEDMRAVVSAGLGLLEAVREDPAHAMFVKGLDSASVDALWTTLEDAGYLMPGENSDRRAPIGDQKLRGTTEEQQSILNQCSSLAHGLVMPDSISLSESNGPTLAAFALKNAVSGVRTEEYEVQGHVVNPEIFQNSDFMAKDANAFANYVVACNDAANSAQYEPGGAHKVLVPKQYIDSMAYHLGQVRENGINEAMGHRVVIGTDRNGKEIKVPTFEAPGIEPDLAFKISESMKWAAEMVDPDRELYEYTGDDAAEVNSEGGLHDEANSLDNAFDYGHTEPKEFSDLADQYVHGLGNRDNMGDTYLGVDDFVAVNASMFDQVDMMTREIIESGALNLALTHAGRAPKDVTVEKASFLSLDDAIGAGKTTEISTPVKMSSVLSKKMKDNMNPERQANLKYIEVTPGRGLFSNYEHAAPESAAKRMRDFINENIINGDGKPNKQLRNVLRQGAGSRIVAPSVAEAVAFKTEAVKFVERDAREFDNRRIPIKDENVSTFRIPADDAKRMADVLQSGEDDTPIRVTIDKNNRVILENENAPRIDVPLTKVSEPLAKHDHDKSDRKIGSMIRSQDLLAAVQTGATHVIGTINGESVTKVAGDLGQHDEPTKKATRKHEDVVLS